MNFTAERFAELASLTAPMDAPFQNLMFLLAAGSLPVACELPVDGGDTDTLASDTEPTHGDGNTSAAMTCGSTSDSGSPESSDASSGSASAGDSTGEPDPCAEYGDAIGACFGPDEGNMEYLECSYFANAIYGTPCAAPFDEIMTCLSELTCAELAEATPATHCVEPWTQWSGNDCTGWPHWPG